MIIFVTKNGQRLGPYTVDQINGQVNSGTLLPSDWAWYQGVANWIPLTQIPGYRGPSGGGTLATLGKRPILVWIISFYYFIRVPFGIVSLIISFFHVISIAGNQSAAVDYQYAGTFAAVGLVSLIDLVGAVLLFLMRRAALYCFAGAFLFGLLDLGYQIVFKHWLAVIDTHSYVFATMIANLTISYLIKIGVLGYTVYLSKAKVLR